MDSNSIARTERNSLSFRQLVHPGCQNTFNATGSMAGFRVCLGWQGASCGAWRQLGEGQGCSIESHEPCGETVGRLVRQPKTVRPCLWRGLISLRGGQRRAAKGRGGALGCVAPPLRAPFVAMAPPLRCVAGPRSALRLRRGRLRPARGHSAGHPRLSFVDAVEAVGGRPSPAMTKGAAMTVGAYGPAPAPPAASSASSAGVRPVTSARTR